MKSIKKLLSLILIISLLFNMNIYAEDIDVNTDTTDVEIDDGDGFVVKNEKWGWNQKVQGARVSLWNVETQTLIDAKNMVNFAQVPYEEVLKYRSLSHLTKPEIIDLGYEITDEIEKNLYNLNGMGTMLSPNSVKFPEQIYFLPSQEASIRTFWVKDFYGKEENCQILIKELDVSEEDIDKWKQGKAVILVEPLISFYNGKEDAEHTWIMTCAELGILAVNGYADDFKTFSKGHLGSTFKYVAFGTFKETAGLITSIAPYETDGTVAITAVVIMSGWKDMVNKLGCLEICTQNIATPSEAVLEATISEILIKFHSNLEQLGGTGGIDEQYNLIGTVNSSDYKRQENNSKVSKIPKTYLDDIAKACQNNIYE